MATFNVDVCSATDSAGRTVRYDTPESFPVEHSQVRLVGTYIGSDHRANGVIFLDPPSNSPHAILHVATVQSKMAIHHLRLSARDRGLAISAPANAPAPVAVAMPKPVAPAPAPVLKPRSPVTTAGR